MIIISDCSKNIVIPAGLGDNAGVVYETAGVKSLNGETGDVKIKTVNGQSLMGEGDVPVDVGVETLNGQKGALTLKTVNGNELTGDGNIEIQAGSDDVIVLDNLSQEERKAVYDKLDRTKPIKQIFKYLGSTSFHYTIQGDWIKIYFLACTVYNAGEIREFALMSDGKLEQLEAGMNYPNFLFFNVNNYTDEGADFECEYQGDTFFLNTTWTKPNGYFLILKKGIGDSTKFMVLPLTVLYDKEPDNSNIPIRIQFIANEKLYTYLHGDADGKWLFESAKPITGGGGATNALTYKQITNENRQEVYDDVKAHWSDVSGYTGNYVYFYQKDKDQIIFDEVKFEGDVAYFNSAAINYTSGQVHNPLIRLLCCIVRAEGDIQLAENDRVISDVNGMRYICSGEIKDGGNVSFSTNSYGDGYEVYESTNTGGKDGMFDVQFENGIDGYKGNTPANIFTDGTDVFMAFDVVDYHYVYKKVDNSWVFVSKVKIGGVQSSEVSNIKVLTQAEYDTLTPKDDNVLYCIKG